MYIKTLLATLFLVHVVNASLNCYVCDSSEGDTNCRSGSGVRNVTCSPPPSNHVRVCLAFAETVSGVTKYIRKCDGELISSACDEMRNRGRDIGNCYSCYSDYCNGNPL
ncbi:hypothetical protein PPYR_03456 [Photinus pyralis]|uniref:Protein sleepless n=1 Tax=Photinus pyralis TaxID=7054 RepID=A0A5N4A2X1_PHOPY|nr:uncharacterized protein LOC116161896 [Photinus pyralis]KAB0791656.1 hypothetical protein PPYR_03456 [Photinus pyralis]